MKMKHKLFKTLFLPSVVMVPLLTVTSLTSCKEEPIIESNCCVVQTIEECPVSFSVSKWAVTEGSVIPNFQFSLDKGKTWKEALLTQEVETGDYVFETSFPSNSYVWIKGNNPNGLLNSSKFEEKGTRIRFNGKVNLHGSIMGLLDNATGKLDIIPSTRCFKRLFAASKIVNVDKKFLPALGLNHSCYEGLFKDCLELLQAPDLPATNVEPFCYDSMFLDCPKLETAPELNAEYLEESCYQNMFCECVSLKKAPVLNSTHLYKSCYDSMFKNCISLTDIPDLPAIQMAEKCYRSMFSGCTGLVDIDQYKLGKISNLSEECFDNMFSRCTNLLHPLIVTCLDLATGCYREMYESCTNLTFQKNYFLPAHEIEAGCYERMFSDCDSLVATPLIEARHYAPGCFKGMFAGCDNLQTTMDALPDSKLYTESCYGMFENCVSLKTAPALPSTDLGVGAGAIDCYGFMFHGCRSLEQAPDLPATDLSIGCYQGMFEKCVNIKSIKVYFDDWQLCWERGATTEWFSGVDSGGAFYCKQALINSATDEERFSSSGVPVDSNNKWTEVIIGNNI